MTGRHLHPVQACDCCEEDGGEGPNRCRGQTLYRNPRYRACRQANSRSPLVRNNHATHFFTFVLDLIHPNKLDIFFFYEPA